MHITLKRKNLVELSIDNIWYHSSKSFTFINYLHAQILFD
jgi:hypothetical protein